jgi:hypothetical protein
MRLPWMFSPQKLQARDIRIAPGVCHLHPRSPANVLKEHGNLGGARYSLGIPIADGETTLPFSSAGLSV